MATLIVIFTLLCFAHYYIESVIIPIELKSISLKLEDLKAELATKRLNMPHHVFEDLENSITSMVNIINDQTFSDYLASAVATILSNKIDHSKVILKHESKMADDILKKFNKLVWSASLTSVIGFVFYFTPILFVISLINFFSVALRRRFKILSMRTRDLFFPAFLVKMYRSIPSDITLSAGQKHSPLY